MRSVQSFELDVAFNNSVPCGFVSFSIFSHKTAAQVARHGLPLPLVAPIWGLDCFVAQPEVHSFVLACKSWGECRASPWLGAPQLRKGLAGGVLTTSSRRPTQHTWRDFPTDRSGLFTAWWNSFRHHTESPQRRLSNYWASTASTVKQSRSGCKRRARGFILIIQQPKFRARGFIIWGWGKVRPMDQTCSGRQPSATRNLGVPAPCINTRSARSCTWKRLRDSSVPMWDHGLFRAHRHQPDGLFRHYRKIKKCRRCRCQRAIGESWARIRIWHASDFAMWKKHTQWDACSQPRFQRPSCHKPQAKCQKRANPVFRATVLLSVAQNNFPQELFK